MAQKISKESINPITIECHHPETGLPMKLTINRLHVQEQGLKPGFHRGQGDPTRKIMTVMIWVGEPENPKSICVNLDENTFLDAIGYLFPKGELSDVHLAKKS